jgi:hypothetical protein
MRNPLNRVTKICSLLFILFSVIAACAHQAPRVKSDGQPQLEYTYQVPEKVADGWEISSLKKEGVNSEIIIKLIGDILNEKFKNIHSVLLVKNGKLILEEYFYGYDRKKLHEIRSATKSIGSVLTGIAIDKGFISSENETIYPYFESYEPKEKWDLYFTFFKDSKDKVTHFTVHGEFGFTRVQFEKAN